MKKLKNYINGEWIDSSSNETINVINPATSETISLVPKGIDGDIEKVVSAAKKAYKSWKNVPVTERVQFLFKMKRIIENNIHDIATICTLESGKTLDESKAEIKRAVENIEIASAMPQLMQGEFSEDIARGIDEFMIRQPIGVAACIAPFNFPIMIPFWFMPYAIAAGNCYIIKPSDKVPETMVKIFKLLEQAGLPKGVLNLVHGSEETVNTLLKHHDVKAISFVGSTLVAKHIYSTASNHGKRVQAQGGAKNPLIIMQDADLDLTAEIVADSVYGCAGQRCLAASNIITIGENNENIKEAIVEVAKKKIVGFGMEAGTHMGPVITQESKTRIESIIDQAVHEGARLMMDGRNAKVQGYENGYFLNPTVLDNVSLDGEVINTEIFGPVLSFINFKNLDSAIEFINNSKYGNAASIFTNDGGSARKFRHDVEAGNIGVNIGIAAPMAFFPFSGWKDSFYGDLHAQSKHAIEFFTQTKVVIERWNKSWTRKF